MFASREKIGQDFPDNLVYLKLKIKLVQIIEQIGAFNTPYSMQLRKFDCLPPVTMAKSSVSVVQKHFVTRMPSIRPIHDNRYGLIM